ncbi:c-type cytochrome [Sphingomonas aerophila]|uniref:Cytochrome c551/c552 n=1 Tax=Sphingomonas aerophila TaxID=1344948 RepID=A0A7W9BGI0_9SPHN|nr:c-type cytochrome [Sphingomonas aerophila]MBB5716623.1 cytochrome c551/c552 [Sphingomonas aerophila]
MQVWKHAPGGLSVLAIAGAVVLAATDVEYAVAAGPLLEINFISPVSGASRPWHSQVAYSIAAVYDGKSTKFGELEPNAVVLEARYVPDVAVAAQLGHELPDALVTISQSNCAGCHDFNARGAGPSYAAIGARYAGKSGAAAAIAANIVRGSSGVWGASAMPPHPDVSAAQARAVAEWIISHGNDAAVQYGVGTTGNFRMIPVGRPGPRAGIVATAFYAGPLKAGDTRRTGAGADRIIVTGAAHP